MHILCSHQAVLLIDEQAVTLFYRFFFFMLITLEMAFTFGLSMCLPLVTVVDYCMSLQ